MDGVDSVVDHSNGVLRSAVLMCSNQISVRSCSDVDVLNLVFHVLFLSYAYFDTSTVSRTR